MKKDEAASAVPPLCIASMLFLVSTGSNIASALRNYNNPIAQVEKFYIGFGLPLIAACLLTLGYLLSIVHAVDKGMALLGFFRVFTVVAFVLLMYQQHGAYGWRNTWDVIPLAGALSVIMAVVGIGASFFTYTLPFFQSGRLGGVMEYANTYALWLLLGLVILAFKDKPDRLDYALFALNICGIFLTVSRSMFVLTAASLVLLLVLRKGARRMIITMTIAALLIGLLLGAMIGAGEWGRLAETPGQAGEWLSRMVYYRDALAQIKQQPMGLGYLGYWYTQPMWQTAYYDTRFVHSGLLQFALDIGALPALMISGLGIFMIIRKKTPLMEKLMLTLILGHALIDIDLEFLALIFVICLCVKPDKAKAVAPRAPVVMLLLLIPLFVYFGAAAFDAERGDGDLAIKMYPGYTEAWEKQLILAPTLDIAVYYAQGLLEMNPYNFVAIDTLARACSREGDYELAAILKLKSLEINRMLARDYLELLDICAAGYQSELTRGNRQSAEYFRQIIVSIPGRIEAVKEALNADAYRLKHTPELDIPVEAVEYIELLRLDKIKFSLLYL